MSTPDLRHYPLDFEALPNDWASAVVGDVALEIRPGFASGKHNQAGEGLPHIRPMNIDRLGCIDLTQVKSVSPKSSDLRLSAGNVLFNNTNSPALIGKTAAITQEEEWAFSNHMTRITLGNSIENRFIAHQLHYLWMRGYFRHKCVNHVNQASVSSTALSDTVPLLIAPSKEQNRIVDKIEELFSDLDAGVKALERAKANLKRYRAAVLNAAVEGKLTEEWRAEHPHTEPASELLERILIEHRQRWEAEQIAKYAAKGKKPPKNWTRRYKPPVEVDSAKLPNGTLPEGWCWTTIDSFAFVTKLAGFEYTKYVNYDPAGDLPVIKAENASRLGFRRTDFSRVKSETVSHLERSQLHGGEVLMVFVGAGVGQVATIPDGERYFLGPNISMIRPEKTLVNPEYLEFFLRSPVGFRLAMSFTKAVAQPSLSMGTIRQIPVAIPPLTEQNKIVEFVDETITNTDRALEDVESTLKRSTRLRQSILRRAFEGKLVPQDPNDEPADKLLACIAAERQAAHERNGSAKRKRLTKKKTATKK